MRTGKSRAMIDLACYLYKRELINAVIVIAPNGVHHNWVERELPLHHWDDVPHGKFAWSSERARRDPEGTKEDIKRVYHTEGLAWFAFNEELFSIPWAKKWAYNLAKRKRFLYIVDESQGFGAPATKKTKGGRGLARHASFNRTLSGTPLDDSPLKAFSQYELLKKACLGFTRYDEFEKQYAEYEDAYSKKRKYKVLKEYKNLDDLKARMARYTSVVLREDCEDMPKLIKTQRHYEPSREQMTLYKALLDDLLIEAEDGTLTTFDGGVRTLKLQQILGGFFVGPDYDVQIFKEQPRLDALMEEVEAASWRGKVIVWARFHVELQMIAARLREKGIPFVEYHGHVKQSDRAAARSSFLAPGGPQVFLGQPRAGGKGLNLSSARSVLWYSYSFSAEERKQADERATLIGAEDIDVVDIVAVNWMRVEIQELVDSYILRLLEDKSARAEDLTRTGMRDYLLSMLA